MEALVGVGTSGVFFQKPYGPSQPPAFQEQDPKPNNPGSGVLLDPVSSELGLKETNPLSFIWTLYRKWQKLP